MKGNKCEMMEKKWDEGKKVLNENYMWQADWIIIVIDDILNTRFAVTRCFTRIVPIITVGTVESSQLITCDNYPIPWHWVVPNYHLSALSVATANDAYMQVVSKYRFRSKKEELYNTEAVCSSSVMIDLAHSSEIFPKRQHTSVFFFHSLFVIFLSFMLLRHTCCAGKYQNSAVASACSRYIIYYFLWLCSPARAMASPFTRFLDHTQQGAIVGRTPLDEWPARRRDLYLKIHFTHNRQTSMPPMDFEPTISAGERP
jgi:hypothetical protein